MKRGLLVLAVVVLGFGVNAFAQLHGLGRIQGSVVDESGAPVTEVAITARRADSAGTISGSSNAKGEWAVGGMGKGEWELVFEKPGYAQRRAKVNLAVELARIPPISITMRKL